MRTVYLIPLLLLLAGRPAPAVEFTKGADGSYQVAGKGYTAAVNKEGYLTSLKVGAVEAVGEAFAYQPNAKLAADSMEPAGDTLKVHLKGNGEATLDYAFRPDGLTITPTWKAGGYAEFRFTASKALLGIELLNDKSVNAGDAVRFVEHGQVRGVPAVPSSRNQMVRFHFPGFGLHAYVQAWGAPFNYESAGGIRGYTWGRPLLAQNQAFPILLTIQKEGGKATLPAPAFVPRATPVASLYYADEPCTWDLDLGERKAYQYLLDAGVSRLDVAWKLTDVHDRPAGAGKAQITLDAAGQKTLAPVTLKVPGSGYYQAVFTLSEPSGKMLASSFLTRFTVIHKVPGLTNRDDSLAGKGISDYAVVAMIGVGGIRESRNIGDYFSNTEQKAPDWVKVADAEPAVWMNAKRLDDEMSRWSAEASKYHLTWFFQANSRPAYATPAVYEAMAYALVARCDRYCGIWEVENEPNFGYSPQDYVTKCLIPFAKGAKRADPKCIVMGPGTVSLSHTLRFMDAVYAADAGHYLNNISTHTYPGPGESWERFGNLGMLAELRDWMKAHNDGSKALWQTEQGYAWDNSPKGQCARYAVRQFLQGWRFGITPNHQYYFYPHSHGFESWYQAGGGEAGSEESWLPIAAAQRFLAENTAGMTYAGDIASPYKGIYLSRFTGDAEDVVAAWTFDMACPLSVRAPGLVRAVDWMGNPVGLAQDKPGLYSLPLSGEPIYLHLQKGSAFQVLTPAFGRDVAGAAAGAVATASSADKAGPASNANDGNWELWENAIGIPGRTSWVSGQKDPSPRSPDWLEIRFPFPRTINRIAALCYLPAVNPSPRDFRFDAEVGGRWKTVAQGKDEWSWVLYREFPPVTATKIRMVVTADNDGWHGDRRWMHVVMGPKATNYTASKLMVAELEAYGPPAAVELSAGVKEPLPAGFEKVEVTAANHAGKAIRGRLKVTAPAGWQAVPADAALELPAGGTEYPSFLLSPQAGGLRAGAVPVDVALVDGAGRTLDTARVTLQVAAPAEITPDTPKVLDEKEQPLSATIRNVTAAPLSGTVALQVTTGGGQPLALPEQPFGPLQPKETASVTFKAPGLKLAGAKVHLLYTAKAQVETPAPAQGFQEVVVTAEQDLAAQGWQVVGPFPNDGGSGGFDVAYGPEKGVDLGATYDAAGGQKARWKPAINDANGFVDLTALFQPNNNVCAYAVLYMDSPAARKAIFSAGSDDGMKAWLNGKLIVSDNVSRGAAPDQEHVPVMLKAGRNEILLKITQGGYGWGFYCEVR